MCVVNSKHVVTAAPLGVVDPQEQEIFKRRDSYRRGGMSRTTSECSGGASAVTSPVTPQVGGMLTISIFSVHSASEKGSDVLPM